MTSSVPAALSPPPPSCCARPARRRCTAASPTRCSSAMPIAYCAPPASNTYGAATARRTHPTASCYAIYWRPRSLSDLMPLNPLQLLAFIVVLGVLLAFVQVGVLTVAFEKLGLSAHSAFTLLFGSLFGSAINLPTMKIAAERPPPDSIPAQLRPLMEQALRRFDGTTIIAVNVGGCLIPVLVSYYLLQHHPIPLHDQAMAVAIVALVSLIASRPVPGLGLSMPIIVRH